MFIYVYAGNGQMKRKTYIIFKRDYPTTPCTNFSLISPWIWEMFVCLFVSFFKETSANLHNQQGWPFWLVHGFKENSFYLGTTLPVVLLCFNCQTHHNFDSHHVAWDNSREEPSAEEHIQVRFYLAKWYLKD